MTAPRKRRRCACGRPATHRLKRGVASHWQWYRRGVQKRTRVVRLDAVCQRCAVGCQDLFGGRVYRWRRVRGGAS
jgi:hypothetical protein